jgi:hypothetical protein
MFVIVVLAMGTTACFQPKYFRPYYNAEAKARMPGWRVILHPLFFAAALPVAEENIDQANQLIKRYLFSQDFDVECRAPDPRIRQSLMEMAVAGKRTNAFDEYTKTNEGGKPCDFVMFPFVILRQAELHGWRARWDGVERDVPHDGSAHGYDWSGFQKAASLSVAVFNCHGELVQSSLGGLEIPFQVQITLNRDAGLASPVDGFVRGAAIAPLRPDFMADPKVVEAAIQLALHPMIPMKDYPKSPTYYPAPTGH